MYKITQQAIEKYNLSLIKEGSYNCNMFDIKNIEFHEKDDKLLQVVCIIEGDVITFPIAVEFLNPSFEDLKYFYSEYLRKILLSEKSKALNLLHNEQSKSI